MIAELISKNRSYRRFYQEKTLEMETLRELVNLARLSPSGRNMQPLNYVLSCTAERNEKIFATLGWALYLKDWPGPVEGERPSAYIIILGNKEITPTFGIDHGIAAQSILLGAVEKGQGGCIIATVQKKVLAQELGIPERYEILLVLALGTPREEVVVDPLGMDGDIKYWRDDEGRHHVPKRALQDLILDI